MHMSDRRDVEARKTNMVRRVMGGEKSDEGDKNVRLHAMALIHTLSK